jgi:chromosomal replication initiation ATPase DnaA
MELSVKETWNRLLEEARHVLPDATVRTWLDPAEPIALSEGRLIVGTPDQFAAEWNESKHASVLSRLASDVLGTPLDVVFQVQEDATLFAPSSSASPTSSLLLLLTQLRQHLGGRTTRYSSTVRRDLVKPT